MKRYYDTYGKMVVCARVLQPKELTSTHIDVTEMIETVVGISSLFKNMMGGDNKKIRQAVAECDFVISRCPGIISFRAADAARKLGKKYLAEAMGCAWDAYWNHGVLGKIVAPYMYIKMRQSVYHANYALYVTSRFLQGRYPCNNVSVAASNVLIENIDETVLQRRLEKISNMDRTALVLMTTAAVDVRYKGQEFVIRAIPELNKVGVRVRYLLVGGGDQTYLKGVAKLCGVEDQVEFVGRQTLDKVFELLDQTDIYIQPSLQEGLPRSVIEAMSRGCPALGAKTAGIPELIASECVVRKKSVHAIARAIQKIADPKILMELAKQNFEHSKEYQDYLLSERRNKLYKKVLEDINSNEQ